MSETAGQSRFFRPLVQRYSGAPSILLCRVPELEYASALALGEAALDHCCGDAIFAGLGWPGEKFAAGCDLSAPSIEQARLLVRHRRLDVCDAAERLPYDDASFELVFNNSALEHIPDLDRTLAEVARVVRPGGRFAFNVLNHRYFTWWPAEAPPAEAYREWQPFLHALNREEWTARLGAAGFRVRELHGYFSEEAARTLARLDSEFSGHFASHLQSALVAGYQSSWWTRRHWRKRIAELPWRTEPEMRAPDTSSCASDSE